MKSSLIITVAIITIILCGCLKYDNEYNDLSNDNSLVFKLNDTLIYSCSDSTKADSFIVSNYKNDYRVTANIYYYQYEKLDLVRINDTTDNVFSIYHENLLFEITWADMHCKEYYVSKPKVVNYVINKDTISNVYVISNSKKHISKIYYHKNYGILRYNIDSTEYYELKLKMDTLGID